ncbi:MAG: hypothetical protein VX278_14745 [Myxococcota bacterium]|nr:hypothetical protein [Myxococcota bacterium]
MRVQARVKNDSFSLKERVVAYEDLSSVGDAFAQIYDGELDVLIIQDVFSKDHLADVVRILDRNDDLLWSKQESQKHHRKQNSIFGVGIAPNGVEPHGPSPEKYLESAKRFRKEVRAVFGDAVDPIERIQQTLSSIAGGKNTRVPIGKDGRLYSPFTIRSIPPGKQFDLHTGNFFYATAAYDALRDQLDTTDQISFFTPLRRAEGGGELEIFNLRWGDQKTPSKHKKILSEVVESEFSSYLYDLDEGEMIVFDGGRLYHRVNPVLGERHRFTLGGFAAMSDTHEEVLYWG